ncbi:MAG TPA: O-antigen ligase family protein [Patescibacteria group bacterium]|nr:O-antigen ligase family protein [Patescibacteria group bacterium]
MPQFTRIINLENYFLLVIFLLPVYLLRFSIFKLPENFWEILALVAIVLALRKKYKNVIFSEYDKKIFILSLLILFGLILGMIKNGNYPVGLGIIKSWLVVPFAFAFFAGKIVKNESRAYFSLYLSIVGVAIVALIYKILGVVTFDGRLESIFNSPNYLAMYLGPGIIIGAVIYGKNQKSEIKKENNNSKLQIIGSISFLAIVAVLYFTYSYAAWISLIVTSIIILAINKKLSKKYFYILALIFLTLIFIIRGTAKFDDLVNYNSRSSLASRIMIWQSAGKILGDNYFLGIGPGDFQEKYLEYQKYFPPYLEWAVPHPHNIFLAFWLNAGLFGLLAFCAVLYIFFKKKLYSNFNYISLISIGIVIYFLFHGLVDTTYFKNDLATYFWLAVFI